MPKDVHEGSLTFEVSEGSKDIKGLHVIFRIKNLWFYSS